MTQLDHFVVKVNDVAASIDFYTTVLGFSFEGTDGPFALLRVNADLQMLLDPSGVQCKEHYAFAVSREQFDAIVRCLQSDRIAYGPSFDSVGSNSGPGRENGARGFAPTLYFNDPNDHLVEIRSYER